MKTPVLFALALMLTAYSFGQKSTGNAPNVFNNAIYARVGYGFPGGTLNSEKILTAAAQFEVGTLFYINSLPLPQKLKLGIDATYLSITGLANKDSLDNNNETTSYFTAGAKLGPCLSYNFAGNWIADAFFKIEPHYFFTGQKGAYDAATQFKIGTSIGFNLRYRAFMLGWELTSANYDFNLTTAPETVNKTIKLPVSLFSIGVNL